MAWSLASGCTFVWSRGLHPGLTGRVICGESSDLAIPQAGVEAAALPSGMYQSGLQGPQEKAA